LIFLNFKTANWAIEDVYGGFVIKNIKYEEYLYAAAMDHAYDESRRRSVFTWKDYKTLGTEGIWNLSLTF